MNQLKAGASLNYVIIILNMLVGLLYTPYMLKMMGQSEYGLYSLVASVISYLTVLDLGLGNAIIRYTAKFRAEGKVTEQYEMFGMFLLLYITIGLIAFVGGLGLYFNVDALFLATMTAEELDKARIMMLFLVFNVAITFPLSIFGSIITAYERFVFPKVINIIRIVLNTVIMICLLGMGYKAIAMVILQTIFNLLTLIINYFYCKHRLHIKIFFRNFQWGFLKEVAVYSFWIFLNVIMDRIYWSTGQFILGAFVGTITVAIFAVAIQLQQMYMNFSTAIINVFLPKVTHMVMCNSIYTNRDISDLFIRTGRLQFIIMSVLLSGFIVFGKQFIILWAGEGYEDTYIIALLFFIAMLPDLIQNLGYTILQARNKVKYRTIIGLTVSILSLFLQILLVKQYSAIGCAVAISVSFLFGQGIIMNLFYYYNQKLDIITFWKEIALMSITPIVTSSIVIILLDNFAVNSWAELLLLILIYCVVYYALFWKFSMNIYERNMFTNVCNKILGFFRH